MGIKEKNVINERLLNLKPNERLIRLNAGMAWTASPKQIYRASKKMNIIVNKGDMILKQARPFHGAPVGWPDLSGFTQIEITSDMVGKKIAVFTGEEVKATGSPILKKHQKLWQELILKMGGIFKVLTE